MFGTTYFDVNSITYKILPDQTEILYNVSVRSTKLRTNKNTPQMTAFEVTINKLISDTCNKYARHIPINTTIKAINSITEISNIPIMCSIKIGDKLIQTGKSTYILKNDHHLYLEVGLNAITISNSNNKTLLKITDPRQHSLPEILSNALDLYALTDHGKSSDANGLKNKYNLWVNFTNLYVLPKIRKEKNFSFENLPEFNDVQ
jgi:hypothetical protein